MSQWVERRFRCGRVLENKSALDVRKGKRDKPAKKGNNMTCLSSFRLLSMNYEGRNSSRPVSVNPLADRREQDEETHGIEHFRLVFQPLNNASTQRQPGSADNRATNLSDLLQRSQPAKKKGTNGRFLLIFWICGKHCGGVQCKAGSHFRSEMDL